MIEIESIEFHADVFHAGKNFGKKVGYGTGKVVSGLSIQADDKREWVFFTYNGRTREIPVFGNVLSWERKRANAPAEPLNEHQTHDVTRVASAQVETPMSHVFEGRGKGRTKT